MKRRSEALKAAKKASDYAASLVHEEMQHGLRGLAFTRNAAPWVGVLGALQCIYYSFGGMRSEGTSLIRVLCGGVAEGVAYVAFSLLVAIGASIFRSYLLNRAGVLDSDMKIASVQLLDDLSSITF